MASIKGTGAGAATRKLLGIPDEQPIKQQQQPPSRRNGQRDSRGAMPRPVPAPLPDPRRLDQQQTRDATGSDRASTKLLNKKIFQPGQFNRNEKALAGEINWTDVTNEERARILKDPNFYKQNKITEYQPWMQQQILADSNFDWKQLPKWQQAFYSVSSNPAGMGAAQGLIMGAGNPGGAVVGAALGWAGAKSGYDQNKEFWKQDNVVAGAFGLMNWAAEQAEKGIGTAAVAANYAADPNKQVSDIFKNFEATWNAGGNFFETLAPAFKEAADPRNHSAGENALALAVLPLYMTAKIGDVILNPEKYKGNEIYLGASNPIPLDETWIQRIEGARRDIEAGKDYREVMTDMQTGIMAQLGDMVGQGIADPLNFVGSAEAKAGEITARLSGDKIAEAAFSKAEGFSDARQRIQNLIANPAEALKIDPNYKVSELGWISKSMSGLTKDMQLKGGLLPSAGALLDYNPPKKSITGFIDSLTSLTPEARARTGQDLLVRNLGSIMASYFNGNDVAGFSNWWKSFTKGDMTQSAELSRTMAQSPEFYTVLPAAKGFDIDGQLAVWETSEPARMAVSRIADVLGENPMTFIEDVARRGTGAEDFARIQDKLKAAGTPEAKALLADIEAGRFTEASLTEAVNAFADGKVPFHPGQWMAETLDAIKEHYDKWAVDHFKLEEESRKTLFRVSAVMKSAQSILLLGANPGYMISNVLPTMVTRAAHGVYGYMTPTALDNFFSRMGFSLEDGFAPSRLEEGVGPGGLIDQTRQTGDAIREATLGKGKLTDIQRALGKIGSAMPFNKLSRLLEGYEGKMAYAIGIKKMWGESWRRGTGFREIPPALLTELTRTVGKSAGDILYSQIEAGMTKQEIQSIVAGRSADIQSRSLINTAAQELNIPSSKAASMLEQLGVLDGLDANLKGANTEGRIRAAFENARRTAQAEIDQQASRDAIARIEHISNRIQVEGPKAITDIVLDTEAQGIDKWLQHYERMGEAADAMDSIPNADTRNRIWGMKYAESNAEYRRHAAVRGSTYLGILKAVGLDTTDAGRGWLATIADTDRVLDNTYRTMRDLRDQHFKKWNNDWENPRRSVERGQVESQINAAWKKATKTETQNLAKMGELLAQQYEQLFSPEAGEAARQAWDQITAFRKEMITRRDDFRASLEGMPSAQRQIASKEFWQGNYNYMVIEMGRIKQEAIARLDRIALNGKGGAPTGAGIDPTRPGGGGGGYVNPEMEALRQQAQERARIQKEKEDAIWEVASQYSKKLPNNSSNFDKGYLQDGHHLLNTLRKEEYGGDPTITNLKDAAEKLTPEQVKNIFEAREGNKAEAQAAFEAEQARRFQEETANAELRAKNKKVAENVQILQNIRKRGGIDIESWKQIADKPEGYQVGVFSRNGKNRWAADQMARLLADDGYPIDVNDPADFGGVQQMIDLIQRARAGEEIYPIGHEFIVDAEVAKAQADYIERQIAEANYFDTARWESDMADAIEAMDMNKATDLWEQLPEDVQGNTRINGETFSEYAVRAVEEITARTQAEAETISIAENQVRAEAAVKHQDDTANTAMTRQLFREKLQDAFGLNEDMTDTVMSLTDARAESWATLGNGSADDWYATRIADVVKDGGKADLAQSGRRYNRVDLYQVEKARKAYTEKVMRPEWVDIAIKEFGVTKSVNEAGYILPDGRMLDLSGKADGGMPNQRGYDHREVGRFLPDEASPDGSATQYMLAFASQTGSVRFSVIGDSAFVDVINTVPNEAQIRAIKNAVKGFTDITFDVTDSRGNVLLSGDLPSKSTSIDRIVNDARRVFEGTEDGQSLENHYTELYQEAYHGSPHRFDQFTLDHMGSGEGAQAYGWGLYFAGDKKVAEWYRKNLAGKNLVMPQAGEFEYGGNYYTILRDIDGKITDYVQASPNQPYVDGTRITRDEYSKAFQKAQDAYDALDKTGQLYKVEIPDENYLLWDKPLSEQPESVQQAVRELDKQYSLTESSISARNNIAEMTGGQIYRSLSWQVNSGDKAASLALKEAGINGIQYLDGSSRGKGEGNYNYVIFDDAAIQIKETYYQTQGNKAGPTNAKGGVQFLDDGKAIIRAFEKADVYTAIHEISHVFFKDLPEADYNHIKGWIGLIKKGDTYKTEVGNFTIRETGTDFIYKDISGAERKFATFEQARAVLEQEAFARGFEKYLADGSAPTPKMKTVFEKFKAWAAKVYGAIIGSPIDVNLTAAVKDVFDRLLSNDRQANVDVGDILMQLGYDTKTHRLNDAGQIVRREEMNIRVNKENANAQAEALVSKDFQSKLDAMKKGQPVRTEPKVDMSQATVRGTEIWKMTEPEYRASLLQEQKDFATRRIEEIKRDTTGADNTKELARMEEMLAQDTLSFGLYGDSRETYRKAIEKALLNDQPVPENIRKEYYQKYRNITENSSFAGGGYHTTRYEGSPSATYKQIRELEQWQQRGQADTLFQMAAPTDTPEFKNWFGDSKVVDENGSPLVVYHGTGASITEFDMRKANDLEGRRRGLGLGKGKIYLDGEPAVASAYAENAPRRGLGKYPNVMPLYVSIKNPISMSDYHARFRDITGKEIFDSTLTMKERDAAIAKLDKSIKAEGYDGIIETYSDGTLGQIAAFYPEQIKSTANSGLFDPSNPNILFQEADPRMPLGGYEESAGWLPQSEVMDEGWSSEVQPLLDKMQEAATRRLTEPTMDGAYKDLSPEGQKMLQQYLNGVTQDMASTKMAAQRWGAEKRDNAMLNYNRRYGFDKMLDVVFPYQFFYTRSMMKLAARALDKPAWLSNYARLRKQQDRYENNLPERLRGKMRVDAPWLPDWMGDGLYIDPLSVLFTPHNFLRPFEQMTKDKNMQTIEAERILQEWAADGTVSQDQIQEAAQTRGGSTWERALAEAKIRREAEISNPMDFVSTMFGPAWYLTTPAKLLNIGKDGPETLTELPLTRTARAVDTVTQGTWAEPIGNVLGLLAKPEEAFREANNLPQFGEYGDYYTDRNIANMVVEGLITPEEAQIAMIERQGDIFDAAVERTKMELAMRVPTAGFIYAALNEGVAAAAKASVPSLFGAGLLPEGELKYRGMKDEWSEAWKLRDAGDTEAINRFFEKNPEYEAYLAKGKEPEERLRSFLIGQIWDGYMELGDTNRKQATAEMGDLFKQAFLNSETRSYDTLDIEQLTQWAQMVNQRVPNIPQTAPAIANPRQINYYSPEVTQITDTFYQQRKRMYGDYYELEQGYYDLPRSERASYLVANPKLKQYWQWKDSYYKRYPELVPVFKGQVFKRIDTSRWPLGLTDYVEAYAFAGEKLPNGAYKALEQVWINEGRPMDDFDTWVKSQVLPAIQYQSGAQMQP